jgi:hypothetical protein
LYQFKLTHHPPPTELNPPAKLFALSDFTPHPTLLLTLASQSVATVFLSHPVNATVTVNDRSIKTHPV